ncbi:RibD family protein [Microlunatus parietis]|uniref:5-amino-6-(5-phosphoribosylamino)uracil reductase n=1 Tax=Microlunatus parietis TaxID=682979 RepID=A0A7Y9LBH2_9ACTN|nr:dihydrofolate reductase family protein [Microlunatus parietis]NYE71717.1 5-amino-6-(5-phosphoribosylamino)uracil reductase [Microlunatus parietis]
MSDEMTRPHVLLSCAMSIDGYIDDATDRRLLLSNDEDFDRVDAERAKVDAILVGASTIRQDNPRLLVRSDDRQAARVAAGLPASPTKVTLTGTGNLNPESKFFTAGDVEKLVYCPSEAATKTTALLAENSSVIVIDAGESLDLSRILTDLAARGIERLMVEGGQTMHTQFLTAGLVDELQLVVAPFFVGNSQAPRFVADGKYPWTSDNRMELEAVQQIGGVVLLRYQPGPKGPRHVTTPYAPRIAADRLESDHPAP